MSVPLRAYEIHTFQAGRWKIDSVFDDKELALFEATRMDEAGRHAGVRVIEEEYDENTQKTKIRTVFRGSKIAESNSAALERTKQVRQQVAQQKVQLAQDKAIKQVEAVRAEKKRKSNPFRLIGIFTMIALLGIAGIIALRFLHEAV
jgi:hypothetical protein